jgi:hypothetical protein
MLRQQLQSCKTEPILLDTIIQKVQQHVGLSSQSGREIEDYSLHIAIGHQGDTEWRNFLLGQTARHFEAVQQDYISATRQWNNASFWTKNLTLALGEL